ncbi:hypothetical protein [Paraglaciecola sp. 2405UD69-4]|uniref:hypothetical protein n=1 Tax=Paraglaciecola sp. 2405UD69-4 TaxID=3391836 RepID=UPI0039C918D7
MYSLASNLSASIISTVDSGDFSYPVPGTYEYSIRANDRGWLNGGMHTSMTIDMNAPTYIESKTALAVADFYRNYDTRPYMGGDRLDVESYVSIHFIATPYLLDTDKELDFDTIPINIDWGLGINSIGSYSNDISSYASARIQIQEEGAGSRSENYLYRSYASSNLGTGGFTEFGESTFNVSNPIEVFMSASSGTFFNGSQYYDDGFGWIGSFGWVDPIFEIEPTWEYAELFGINFELDFREELIIENLHAEVDSLNPIITNVNAPTSFAIFFIGITGVVLQHRKFKRFKFKLTKINV